MARIALEFQGKPLPARLPLGPINRECSAYGFTPVGFHTTPGYLILVVEGYGSREALSGAINEYLDGFTQAMGRSQEEGGKTPPSLDSSPALLGGFVPYWEEM